MVRPTLDWPRTTGSGPDNNPKLFIYYREFAQGVTWRNYLIILGYFMYYRDMSGKELEHCMAISPATLLLPSSSKYVH